MLVNSVGSILIPNHVASNHQRVNINHNQSYLDIIPRITE